MAIQVLSADVVDRIAAGEVLDRPANLVKELVENSIDAVGNLVEIDFGDGGRSVCVKDNGSGIAPDELALAVLRHATSKITGSEDLFELNSFGFRGEALASIAAVSELTITSRVRGSDQAYRIRSRFGKIEPVTPVSAPEGTEVRVQDLFGNVPARLKFLKSESAEHGQIKNTLKALALAHPSITFSARLKDELLYHWPAVDSLSERAKTVLNQERLFEAQLENPDVKVHAIFTSPQDTMQVNRGFWFFVQDRWVQDRSLNAAIMEAYRNLLMHGEYPTVLLKLRLNPQDVDVNVHPTKSAVKFRDPQGVFRAVFKALRQVLETSPWLDGLGMKPGVSEPAGLSFFDRTPETEAVPQTMAFQSEEFSRTQYSTKSFPLASPAGFAGERVTEYAPAVMETAARETIPASVKPAFQWAGLQVCGQLNHTYIVAQDAEAMYLVDQHAAHERVVFERLMGAFKNGGLDIQTLLIPLTFDFSAEEVDALIAHRESIERMGLTIERLGPETLAVSAIPTVVKEGAISDALQKLSYELIQHGGSGSFESAIGDVFASMACHSVIRAGQSQSLEQMQSLLRQMDDYALSSFCPHGRPVFIKRRFSDIEREFGRIV